jgi:hypothetical protein
MNGAFAYANFIDQFPLRMVPENAPAGRRGDREDLPGQRVGNGERGLTAAHALLTTRPP